MRKVVSAKISLLILVFVAAIMGCASGPAGNEPMPGTTENTTTATDKETADEVRDQDTQSTASPQTVFTPDPAAVQKNNAYDGEIVGGKKLSIPKITGSVPPRDDDYHDTDNNAIVVLQSPTKAMANFPRDRRQEVDWVKTLEMGLIEPRANLKGDNEMMTMDLDILMKNTQFMPWVKFPHIAHTKWLACENCHPKIFIPQQDANPISMNKVLRGEYCGVCHDKVAFSLFVCERCHSVPHKGSGPAWWKK